MNTDLNPCSNSELNLREAFKKEYKLSCPVIDDNDIFQKSLVICNLENEWNDYTELNEKYGDIGKHRAGIVNNIVNCINHVKGFDELEPIPDNKRWSGPRSYLVESNIGKRMVSIDLIKANYQSLKKVGKKYVLDTDTYEELIRRFTKDEPLVRSRMLRQLVFGLLNPHLQASVQRNMMYDIVDAAKKVKDYPILHLTNDEVVFEIESDADLIALQEAVRQVKYDFRVEEFSIHKINNNAGEAWFVKVNDKGRRRKITGVHVKFLFQVYNHIHGLPNEKKDFWWRERGRLCALLEPEQFPDKFKLS